jgi:hypothetical protein
MEEGDKMEEEREDETKGKGWVEREGENRENERRWQEGGKETRRGQERRNCFPKEGLVEVMILTQDSFAY